MGYLRTVLTVLPWNIDAGSVPYPACWAAYIVHIVDNLTAGFMGRQQFTTNTNLGWSMRVNYLGIFDDRRCHSFKELMAAEGYKKAKN